MNQRESASLYPELGGTPQQPLTQNDDVTVTSQPVPVEVPIQQDFTSATKEGTILLDSQDNQHEGAITKQPASTPKKAPEFSSKLFGCCDEGTMCIKAYCCPCISVYSTEKELSNQTKAIGCGVSSCLLLGMFQAGEIMRQIFYYEYVQYGMAGGYIAGNAMAMAGICGLGFLVCSQRRRISKAYGIKSSAQNDCTISFCCNCCALVQHERQVKSGREKIV